MQNSEIVWSERADSMMVQCMILEHVLQKQKFSWYTKNSKPLLNLDMLEA